MSRVGEASLDIADAELDAVVGLFLIAARRTRRRLPTLAGGVDENVISIVLHKELIRIQEYFGLRSLEFHLEGILNDPDGHPTKIDGRIDFKVKAAAQFGDYRAYFGIECKRVAPGNAALQRYYINGGVQRFADSIYGPKHRSGMIVGYVMQPTVTAVLPELTARILQIPGASALRAWRKLYRGELLVEGDVPRSDSEPINILHALVPMHVI